MNKKFRRVQRGTPCSTLLTSVFSQSYFLVCFMFDEKPLSKNIVAVAVVDSHADCI